MLENLFFCASGLHASVTWAFISETPDPKIKITIKHNVFEIKGPRTIIKHNMSGRTLFAMWTPLCESIWWRLVSLKCFALFRKHLYSKIRGSIVVSISACHAEDPGSIPGGGVFSNAHLQVSPTLPPAVLEGGGCWEGNAHAMVTSRRARPKASLRRTTCVEVLEIEIAAWTPTPTQQAAKAHMATSS